MADHAAADADAVDPAGYPGGRVVVKREILAVRDGTASRRYDSLVAEEPLEIRVNGDAVAVTMRTPGHDFDLAVGYLLSERVITAAHDVATIRYCADDPHGGEFNILDVALRDPAPVDPSFRRGVATSSACGLCGTASIAAVRKDAADVHSDGLRVDLATLTAIPDRVRTAQRVFARTGGLHAAALCTAAGDALCVREDVGRHNAVDKVVGWAATAGLLPLAGHLLFVSGRIAFEIAQKALLAGIPMVAAVSAPSSLAVALAEDTGMTLVGFLRGDRCNVYAGPRRLELP